MKIKEITDQDRRDFRAIYVCEHCGAEEKGRGYDDDNFHRNVIPKKVCKKCGKTAPENYRPLGTKHPADAVV
jgi:ribosomal protein L40E